MDLTGVEIVEFESASSIGIGRLRTAMSEVENNFDTRSRLSIFVDHLKV